MLLLIKLAKILFWHFQNSLKMKKLNLKCGIILMTIHLISSNKIEGNFRIINDKGVLVADIDYTEKFKMKSNKKIECVLKCLQKEDCNMAYLKEDNCIVFFKCQLKKHFITEKNSKIFQKNIQCLRNYSNLKGKIFKR